MRLDFFNGVVFGAILIATAAKFNGPPPNWFFYITGTIALIYNILPWILSK